MLDATAVVLLRCAETDRSYWSWTDEQWSGLLGQDQRGFRTAAPGWADDAVRPHLAVHAFLLGGFTAFHRLGSFSRLSLAWNYRRLPDRDVAQPQRLVHLGIITAGSYDRILRLAWSTSDLHDHDRPTGNDVDEATTLHLDQAR